MEKVNVSPIIKHGQTESSDETAKNVEEITTSLQRDIDQICEDEIGNIIEVYVEELPNCDDAGDCHSAGPSLAEDAQSRNIENLRDENDKADVNASPRDGDCRTDVNNGQLDGAKEHTTEEIILEKGDETAKTVEEIATSLQRDIDQICRDKIENIVEVYIEELPTCDDAGDFNAAASLLAEDAQSRNNENDKAHNDASGPRDDDSGTDVNNGRLDVHVAPAHTNEVIILVKVC
nr:uncharacterized protein LOC129281664 [Lytechinus pictus]